MDSEVIARLLPGHEAEVAALRALEQAGMLAHVRFEYEEPDVQQPGDPGVQS